MGDQSDNTQKVVMPEQTVSREVIERSLQVNAVVLPPPLSADLAAAMFVEPTSQPVSEPVSSSPIAEGQ